MVTATTIRGTTNAHHNHNHHNPIATPATTTAQHPLIGVFVFFFSLLALNGNNIDDDGHHHSCPTAMPATTVTSLNRLFILIIYLWTFEKRRYTRAICRVSKLIFAGVFNHLLGILAFLSMLKAVNPAIWPKWPRCWSIQKPKILKPIFLMYIPPLTLHSTLTRGVEILRLWGVWIRFKPRSYLVHTYCLGLPKSLARDQFIWSLSSKGVTSKVSLATQGGTQ